MKPLLVGLIVIERQSEYEVGTLAQCTPHIDLPAMQMGIIGGDCQAQSRAALAAKERE